jgi:ArsR family metal-binding transcriptional regulator
VIDPAKSLRPRLDLNDAGNFTVTKAALRIVSVGRDGKVKLKVISSEKTADDIIRGISNVSFSITVPTNNNEQVPYKVDFRDISGMTVTI